MIQSAAANSVPQGTTGEVLTIFAKVKISLCTVHIFWRITKLDNQWNVVGDDDGENYVNEQTARICISKIYLSNTSVCSFRAGQEFLLSKPPN